MITFSWLSFLEFAGAVLTVVASVGGATAVTNIIKNALGIDGQKAQVLAWLVAAFLALLTASVNGILSPELFADPLVLIATIILVVTGNHRLYQAGKD